MKVCWSVRFRGPSGKFKDRIFEDRETEAREFYEKKKKYGEDCSLMRSYKKNIFQELQEATFSWFGWMGKLSDVAFLFGVIIALVTLWRFFP